MSIPDWDGRPWPASQDLIRRSAEKGVKVNNLNSALVEGGVRSDPESQGESVCSFRVTLGQGKYHFIVAVSVRSAREYLK